MRRVDFLTRLGQLILIVAIAFIAVLLGRKAANDLACNSCPGKGICSDFSDCSNYLSLKNEEKTR